jgi:uncharacterized protein YcgI (DUF1989 family)
MGHDVAGREVTDFVTFVARHARTRTSARREAASTRRLPHPIASRVPSNQPAMKEATP